MGRSATGGATRRALPGGRSAGHPWGAARIARLTAAPGPGESDPGPAPEPGGTAAPRRGRHPVPPPECAGLFQWPPALQPGCPPRRAPGPEGPTRARAWGSPRGSPRGPLRPHRRHRWPAWRRTSPHAQRGAIPPAATIRPDRTWWTRTPHTVVRATAQGHPPGSRRPRPRAPRTKRCDPDPQAGRTDGSRCCPVPSPGGNRGPQSGSDSPRPSRLDSTQHASAPHRTAGSWWRSEGDRRAIGRRPVHPRSQPAARGPPGRPGQRVPWHRAPTDRPTHR